MFKTDGMDKRSAIRYLETKYDLLEGRYLDLSDQYNKLFDKIEKQEFDRELEEYGLIMKKAPIEGFYIYKDEDILNFSSTLQFAKKRFEGYKKGFEQPIDILVEVEDDNKNDLLTGDVYVDNTVLSKNTLGKKPSKKNKKSK